MIQGAIGEGATIEFDAYLRTARELPTIEAILKEPTKSQVPKSPAQLYALATMLSHYTREHNKSAMRLVARFCGVRVVVCDGHAAWWLRYSQGRTYREVDCRAFKTI